jgi:hypothetical protein
LTANGMEVTRLLDIYNTPPSTSAELFQFPNKTHHQYIPMKTSRHPALMAVFAALQTLSATTAISQIDTSTQMRSLSEISESSSFEVSANDAADAGEGAIATVSGQVATFPNNVEKVNDGLVYGPRLPDSGDSSESFAPDKDCPLVIQLAPATKGWDIDKIVVLTGYTQAFRTKHCYRISLSTDGETFGEPIIDHQDDSTVTDGEVQSTFQSSAKGPMATGVRAIQFVFDPSDKAYLSEDSVSIIREIDVFGTPTGLAKPL